MPLTSAVSRAFCLAACFTQSVFQTALSAPSDQSSFPGDDPPASPPPPSPEDSLLFGNGAVGTMLKRVTRLSLRPHYGDLLHDDDLRITLQARYGLTDDWEISCATDLYFGHGLGSTPLFAEPGLSRVQLGTRYQLTEEPEASVGCALGLDYSLPVGNPPESLVEPYAHLSPYVIVSRKLETHPGWTTFVRVGTDFVSLKNPSAIDEGEELASDSWFVAPGVNFERGDWSYTLATRFASTTGIGDGDDYRIGVSPSINWKIPSDWTPGRKARWVLGLGASASFGSGGPDFGVRGSLRTDFDLRNLFKKHRRAPAWRRASIRLCRMARLTAPGRQKTPGGQAALIT